MKLRIPAIKKRNEIFRIRSKDPMYQMLRKFVVGAQDYNFSLGATNKAIAWLNTIPTPYAPENLRRAVIGNNTLLQTLCAIVVNCAFTDYSINYFNKEEGLEDTPEAQEEYNRIEGLAKSPDGKMSLQELKECYWWDRLIYGYAFIEVGRDATGEILWYRWISAKNIKLCGFDPEFVETTRNVYRNGELTDFKVKENFRRYVKIDGAKKTYYKEFGDGRIIDPTTGEKKEALGLKGSATELIHCRNLPLSDYGNTEWENNLPAILGSREAEVVNLEFFRDGGMPALVVMVSGGALTSDAAEAIEHKFNTGQAKDKIHKAIILEATGDKALATGIDGSIPAPKVDIKELGKDGKDALFQEYDANCGMKVRSSMRLPAIYIGGSESYNYATAKASLEVTENQVFGPKRSTFDAMMNEKILLKDGKPLEYFKFVSNGMKISDPEGAIAAMSALVQAGAVDPNSAVKMYNNVFGDNLPEREQEWANIPMAIVAALLNMDKAEEMIGPEATKSIQALKDKFGAPPKPKALPPGAAAPVKGKRPPLGAKPVPAKKVAIKK